MCGIASLLLNEWKNKMLGVSYNTLSMHIKSLQ